MSFYECPIVAEFDPMGFGWSNFQESDLDWPSLVDRLIEIVISEEFEYRHRESYPELYRLYAEHVDSLNTMGCGWFAGFVVGAVVANNVSCAEKYLSRRRPAATT